MKIRKPLFLLMIAVIICGCKNNNFEIDWTGSDYYLDGINENYVQFPEKVSEINYFNEKKELYSIRKYEKGKCIKYENREREYNFVEIYYDNSKITAEIHVVEDKEIEHFSFTYQNDENNLLKIITKTDKSGLKTIFTERKKNKTSYECEISSEKKIFEELKTTREIRTVKIEKGHIVEFASDSKLSFPFYKFDYNGQKLARLSYYTGKSRKLTFTYDYEYDKDLLQKVVYKSYTKNEGEGNIVYTIVFSEFDSYGNWQKAFRIYDGKESEPVYRSIKYTD